MSVFRRLGLLLAPALIALCTVSASGAIIEKLVDIWGADELPKMLTGDQLNQIQQIESSIGGGGLQVQIDSYQVRAPNVGYYQSNAAGSFSLPKFDDQGGTRKLEVVIVTIQGHALNGDTVLDNESELQPSATVWIEASATTEPNEPKQANLLPLVALLQPRVTGAVASIGKDDPAEALTGTPVVFGPYILNADYTGPDSVSAALDPDDGADGVVLDGAQVDLSDFIGPGQIIWDFKSQMEHNYVTVSAPIQVSADPADFYYEASVIYGFMPEPASLALLAAGAVAVAWRRRKPLRG